MRIMKDWGLLLQSVDTMDHLVAYRDASGVSLPIALLTISKGRRELGLRDFGSIHQWPQPLPLV